MSERKVLTKYYPPDFDPRALGRTKAPKQAGPKTQTVRLMSPFSMKCTRYVLSLLPSNLPAQSDHSYSCGEYSKNFLLLLAILT
jgi:hypothetical protein